jgi:Opacity protein and related surface antigens
MKRLLLLLNLMALFSTNSLFGQDANNRWSVGASFSKTEYVGDLGNAFLDFSKAFYPGGGVTASWYLNRSFDLSFSLSYGQYGYAGQYFGFLGMKTGIYGGVSYKLNNGFLLDENVKLAPYLKVGFGFDHVSGDRIWNGRNYIFPAGAGVKYRLDSRWALQYQLLYIYTDHDKRDNAIAGMNDAYFEHSIGIVFSFGGKGSGGHSSAARTSRGGRGTAISASAKSRNLNTHCPDVGSRNRRP